MRTLKLRTRLTVLILLIAVPIFAAVTIFVSVRAGKLLEESALESLRETNHALGSSVSHWLGSYTVLLRQISALPDIISMEAEQQKPILLATASADPSLFLVQTVGLDGVNVARNDFSELRDYSDRLWFLGARDGNPITTQVLISRTTGNPALNMSVPIRNAGGEINGVVSIVSELDAVTAAVHASKVGNTGYAYVVDEFGHVVAHPDPAFSKDLRDLSGYPPVVFLQANPPGNFRFADEQGILWVAYVERLENGWGIIVQQQESELLGPLRYFQFASLAFSFVGILILLIAGAWTIRQALSPIEALTDTAMAITNGDLDRVAPMERQDEVGTLANAFNSMTFRTRELILSLQQRVSQLNETQKALEMSLLRQTAILDNIPDLAWLKDEESRFIAVNVPFGNMSGMSPADLVGKTDLDIWPQELAQGYRNDDLDVIRSGKRKHVEERLVNSSGQENWIETVKTPIFDASGKVIGTAGIARNITERRRVEEELRVSEQKFAKAFRSSPDSVTLSELESGRLIEINDGFQKVFGYSREEAIGHSTVELGLYQNPADRQRMVKILREQGSISNLELKGRHKSGAELTALLSVEMIDIGGRPHMVTITRDISEGKRAEEELIKQTTLFRNLFESSPEAIALLDHEERVLTVNQSFYTLFGYSETETLGRTINDLVAPEPYLEDAQEVSRAVSEESKVVEKEAIRCTKDGRALHVSLIGCPILVDQREIGSYAIYRDITERKRMEGILRQKEEHARSLLKLSRMLEQARTYPEILEAATVEISSILGYSSCWLGLLEEDSENFLLLDASGGAEVGYGKFNVLPIKGDPFLEEIMQATHIVVVEDARTDPRTNKDAVAFMQNRTILNVPLILVDKCLGVLGTGSFGEEGVKLPSQAHLDYLASLAIHIAVALDRVRFLEERQRAEDALRVSEERYRSLAQNLPDSVLLLFDQNLRFIIADGPELAATGFSSEMLEGKTLEEALPPEYVAMFEPNMRRALAGERFSAELPYGDLFYRYHYVPISDESGNVTMAMILGTNITHLKQTEDALKDSQRRLSAAMQATKVGVWEWNMRTNKAHWSDENFMVLGYSPDSIEARYENWAKALHPDDLPAAEAKVSEAMSSQSELNIEFRVIWPDGSVHWINDIGNVVVDETGQLLGMYGIQIDVSERKRGEAEREKLIQELETKNIEAETLRDGAAAVALSLGLEETASRILDQLQRVVPYDSASVQLLTGNELRIVDGRGFPEDRNPIGMRFILNGDDPAYPILKAGAPYILYPDIQQISARFRAFFHDHIHAWMAIPLNARGRLVGMLTVDGFSPGKFTEEHARFALTFANQVAVTLENARLYTELQNELVERQKVEKELRQRESILDAVTASAEMLFKESDWNTVINEILEKLGQTIDASHAYLFEAHPGTEGETLLSIRHEWTAFSCVSDIDNLMYHDMPLHEPGLESWYELIVVQGQPFVGDATKLSQDEMKILNERGIKAIVEMPIVIDDKWWGVIGFDDVLNDREWTHVEVDAMKVAANVLSSAIARQMYDIALENELRERKKLIEELEHKNAELERFTYTVSHDLKSPLVTIKGFLGFLKQDLASGNMERFENDLERIGNATRKMERLLWDLLELSRIGRLVKAPEEVSFDGLVKDALEIVHGQLQARGVTVHVQPDLPAVYGDRQRLTEVLQNLLDNAAKYMGDQAKPLIEIGLHGEEKGLPVFYVRDNGMGIAPQHHERVFGLFNKLDPMSEGTGVGLALVKRIIEFHGGRIWIESKGHNQGTTFCFTLQASPRDHRK